MTEAGTETAALSLLRETARPSLPAADNRLTVQLSLVVPVTDALLHVSALRYMAAASFPDRFNCSPQPAIRSKQQQSAAASQPKRMERDVDLLHLDPPKGWGAECRAPADGRGALSLVHFLNGSAIPL